MKNIIHIILSVLCAYILTEWLCYSQNTLIQNNNWFVTKKLNMLGIMGGDDFLLSRSVLYKNSLNLSKYYGFQEVFTKRNWNLKRIEFTFSTNKNDSFNFKIFQYAKPVWGIVFNTDPKRDSYIYKMGENQEYIDKVFLGFDKFKNKNRVKISFHENKLTINLNNVGKAFELSDNFPFQGQVGFQGASLGTIVDDVLIEDTDYTIFQDSFEKNQDRLLIIIAFLVLILVVAEIIQLLAIKVKDKNVRYILSSQLLFFTLSFFLFDYYYWSKFDFFNQTKKLYTNESINLNKFEKTRFNTFKSIASIFNMNRDIKQLYDDNMYNTEKIWDGPIICSNIENRCSKYYYPINDQFYQKVKSCLRIAFIGTSQFIGSGASSLNKTFYAKFLNKIQKKINGKCIVFFNSSISSVSIHKVWEKYINQYTGFKPQFMILNMGNNDRHNNLDNLLRPIVDYSNENKIHTILSLEANSSHINDDDYQNKLNTLAELGSKYGLYVIDSHSELKLINTDEGNLWWDHVHFTNFGHEAFARLLEQKFFERWPVSNFK